MSGNLRMFQDNSGYLRKSQDVSEYVRMPQNIWEYLRHSHNISEYFRICQSIWEFHRTLRSPGNLWNPAVGSSRGFPRRNMRWIRQCRNWNSLGKSKPCYGIPATHGGVGLIPATQEGGGLLAILKPPPWVINPSYQGTSAISVSSRKMVVRESSNS